MTTPQTQTGTVAAVQAVTLATVLTADAASGSLVLTVEDVTAIPPDGGTLRVGGDTGEIVTYVSIDQDAATVTVDPATVNAWLTDAPVELWDTTSATVGVEYRAYVVPAAGFDEDVIDTVVTHSLVPLLPEGVRDEGSGETVTVTQIVPDAPWVLTDIVNRLPILAGGMIAAGSVLPDALGFTVGGTTATISVTAPGTPQVDDIWFDAANGYVMKQWDGAAWVAYQWNTGSVADGSITADKIAAGSITADLIAAGAVVAGALDAGALNALTIIAGSLTAGSISSGSIGSSSLDGCTITNTDIVLDENGGTILLYAQSAQTTATLTTSGNWTCPAGLTTVKVECWGGGGGGGGGGALGGYGGYGGGGGEYAREQILTVVPGTVYPYVVGSGGASVAAKALNGNGGADTNFDGRVVAHGGTGAIGAYQISGGFGSTNTVHYTGGSNSGSGTAYGPGCGGGSSAGVTKAGNPGRSATVSVGGAGGTAPTGGGAGGAGGANTAVGASGLIPGGAGGGGGGATGAGRASGAGARGQIKITYGGVRTLTASIAGYAGVDAYGTSYPAGVWISPAGNDDTGWVNLTPAVGTGTFAYRRIGALVSVKFNLTATFAAGSTSIGATGTIPSGLLPVDTSFGPIFFTSGFSGTGYVGTTGNVTVANQTGASRTTAQGTINYLVG